jgi:hypothetical protein
MIREPRIHFLAVIEEARIAGLDTNAIGELLAEAAGGRARGRSGRDAASARTRTRRRAAGSPAVAAGAPLRPGLYGCSDFCSSLARVITTSTCSLNSSSDVGRWRKATSTFWAWKKRLLMT